MGKWLFVTLLLIMTFELFAWDTDEISNEVKVEKHESTYDFDKLDTSNDKNNFVNKWYDAFFKWLVKSFKIKGKSDDDIQLILWSIVSDLEWWDYDLVISSLVDEWLDEKYINKLLKASIVVEKPTLSKNTLDNLWKNRINEVVDEYISTWVIPEWYKVFTEYFNQIWEIMKEISYLNKKEKAIIKESEEAKRKWEEAKREIQQIKKLLKQIESIKNQMGSIKN